MRALEILGHMNPATKPLTSKRPSPFFQEVDKDIDILLVANTAADWWATIVALEQLLVSNGWQGCALSARDSGDMATEFAARPSAENFLFVPKEGAPVEQTMYLNPCRTHAHNYMHNVGCLIVITPPNFFYFYFFLGGVNLPIIIFGNL